MNIKDKISIIIPLYNKGNAIEKTIYSVLGQIYDNFEIIIINDGSTDNSVDVIKSFDNDKIKLITQENQGVSAARNRGIDEAEGEWIIFLDADDILLPYALSTLYSLVKKNNVAIGCSNFFILDKKKNVYPFCLSSYKGVTKNINKQIFYGQSFIRMGNSIFSRDLLNNFRFNSSYKRYEDIEFFIRVTHNQNVAVAQIPVMIYSYLHGYLAINFDDISKDYLSHISFKDTNFWERMFLYQILIRERRNYHSINILSLYPTMNIFFIVCGIMDICLRIKKKFIFKTRIEKKFI